MAIELILWQVEPFEFDFLRTLRDLFQWLGNRSQESHWGVNDILVFTSCHRADVECSQWSNDCLVVQNGRGWKSWARMGALFAHARHSSHDLLDLDGINMDSWSC